MLVAPVPDAETSDVSDDSLARSIEHTALRPEATPDDIKKLCEEADSHGFTAVCLSSSYVRLAAESLASSLVRVCTVVGFPHGACTTSSKLDEAQGALNDGAVELGMMLHVGYVRGGFYNEVLRDIKTVSMAAHTRSALLRVILESGLLGREDTMRACRLAIEAGADFVDTSTGFGSVETTPADVRFLRLCVGADIGVKASGQIGTRQLAVEMLSAGANRLGTSRSLSILKG